jgi:DNA processing protein
MTAGSGTWLPDRQIWACDACLARSWLLQRVSGGLDTARGRVLDVLALEDAELASAVGGRRAESVIADHEAFVEGGIAAYRREAELAGLQAACRCAAAYPDRLLELPAPPAVIFVAGEFSHLQRALSQPVIAVIGARRCSSYGRGVAAVLGAGLARSGVTVTSGMALGIDSAAHAGALDAGGLTVAVMPAAAHVSSPASKRALHRRIRADGAAVSELGPGSHARRWSFIARNRLVAALSDLTVVVEATERSGALVTARLAQELGRPVGAVPGQITNPASAGANDLIAAGAALIRGTQDVLDRLYGVGVRTAAASPPRDVPTGSAAHTFDAVVSGADSVAALTRVGIDLERALADLAWLELAGWVRRGAGGRYAAAPSEIL